MNVNFGKYAVLGKYESCDCGECEECYEDEYESCDCGECEECRCHCGECEECICDCGDCEECDLRDRQEKLRKNPAIRILERWGLDIETGNKVLTNSKSAMLSRKDESYIDLLMTAQLLEYSNDITDKIKVKSDHLKQKCARLVYDNGLYGTICKDINDSKVERVLKRMNDEHNLKIVDADGKLKRYRPFKLKLDKYTTARGMILMIGPRYNGTYLILNVTGKNKVYHWLKLRLLFSNGLGGNSNIFLAENGSNTFEPVSRYSTWNRFMSPHKKEIYNYLNSWKECKNNYTDLGKSFKTGILLEGPTGTGKTTAVKAIAEMLGYNEFHIDFNRSLEEQFINIPSNVVVVMEELETKIGKRVGVSKNGHETSVTMTETSSKVDMLGTILQWMDGRRKYNGVVFIATTNDITKLDDAILRKGRFDKRFYMDNFSKKEAMAFCERNRIDYRKVLKNETYPIRPSDLEQKIHEELMLKVINRRKIMEALRNETEKDWDILN